MTTMHGGPTPKRLPGEPNPTPDTRAIDRILLSEGVGEFTLCRSLVDLIADRRTQRRQNSSSSVTGSRRSMRAAPSSG